MFLIFTVFRRNYGLDSLVFFWRQRDLHLQSTAFSPSLSCSILKYIPLPKLFFMGNRVWGRFQFRRRKEEEDGKGAFARKRFSTANLQEMQVYSLLCMMFSLTFTMHLYCSTPHILHFPVLSPNIEITVGFWFWLISHTLHGPNHFPVVIFQSYLRELLW